MKDRIKVLKEKTPGPKVAIVCGAHGNEQNGVLAAEKIFAALEQKNYIGSICVLKENPSALEKGVRYIDRDINRLWSDERIASIDQLENSPLVEERELYHSYKLLREFYDGLHVPAFMFDLHGTSSVSSPFSISFDSSLSFELTSKLCVPTIIWPDSESFWAEVLTSYATRRGVAATVFEVGPLYDQSTANLLEACVWDALAVIKVIGADCENEVSAARKLLARQYTNIPRILQIFYEQRVTSEDEFVMKPGYRNFQKVSKGEHLADDRNGKVCAPIDAYLLFPLYQGVSDYGFALANEPKEEQISEQ